MTIHLSVNHYGCTYYCINEDPYIYMRSLIMKDKKKKDLRVHFLLSQVISSFLHYIYIYIYIYHPRLNLLNLLLQFFKLL